MSVRLLRGDCLEQMRRLDAESVDAVVTDPPYGIAYQSAWRTDKAKRHRKIEGDARPFVWWLADAYRVVRPGGCLLCFCRWDVQEAFRQAIGWAGFEVRSQVVWDRQSHGMGDLNAAFAPQHDVVWFATKGRFTFPGKRPTSIVSCMRLPGEALEHPTQKPVGAMRLLIRSVVPDGGVVLDPFMGSGSTGVAAVEEGYPFVGIELDDAYYETARRRLEGAGHLFVGRPEVLAL